jgi:hypothetical protein
MPLKLPFIALILLLMSPSALQSSENEQKKEDFTFIRQEKDPEISIDKNFSNFDITKWSNQAQKIFREVMEKLDVTIGDVSLRYLKQTNNPLSQYAKSMSERLLQLLEAYVATQITFKIEPIYNSVGGSLKQIGLTHQEVLDLRDLCLTKNYKELLEPLLEKIPDQTFNQLWNAATKNQTLNKENIAEDFKKLKSFYADLTKDQKKLLERTFIAAGFRHVKISDLALKLSALRRKGIQPYKQKIELSETELSETELLKEKHSKKVTKIFKNDPTARLILELQQRVMDLDSHLQSVSYGSLGSNALAILNAVKFGDLKHPLAEFRNRMYFCYMFNDFINEIIGLPEKQLIEINKNLKKYKWQIDFKFIDYLKNRRQDIGYIAPLFRYGAYADLNNKGIRKLKTNIKDRILFPDPNLFSPREKIAIYGDYHQKLIVPITIYTGQDLFDLESDPNKTDSKHPAAAKYITIANKIGLPVIAGISGTLDQSITMANFVGLINSTDDLQIIKLAYIAFMVPNRDHSVHEILQSSKTFGLEYDASPFLHQKVFNKKFAKEVEKTMTSKYGINIQGIINLHDELQKLEFNRG